MSVKITDRIWIGDSESPRNAVPIGVNKILNVAADLGPPVNENGKSLLGRFEEYAQVGLVDGPGNLLITYQAAVLALHGLLGEDRVVLVYDHSGGRALAVVLMYLNLTLPRWVEPNSTFLCWWSWERLTAKVVATCDVLPPVHEAHQEAYGKMPWGMVEVLL